MRCPPEGGTSGWYLYIGDRLDDSDENFFKPLHGVHLIKRYPSLYELLDLPPGYAFVHDPESGYIDIYENPLLLEPAEDMLKPNQS